ncbi:M3 family metallopeptidase [Dickeya chrysanthemi]|uniref:M3 family metallopeptidase n=1 Tax=Dickeya chrysanthemi TaxID=556 RepID=UPI0025A121E0|nr:M3 family metallopeptidase [Dickeya chrysanthemi]WJM85491.1 M3 family metallopeptidase [Dickeya chrysanthemi]
MCCSNEPTILKNYAKHYQNGTPMPQALLDKVIAASKFNQGFATTEYLGAAMLDQNWHQLSANQVPDAAGVMAFEAKALQQDGIAYAPVPPRYKTPYFSHIMGGYAAGYYAYIWSEVLVVLVHLAPVGLDVQLAAHHGGRCRACHGQRPQGRCVHGGGRGQIGNGCPGHGAYSRRVEDSRVVYPLAPAASGCSGPCIDRLGAAECRPVGHACNVGAGRGRRIDQAEIDQAVAGADDQCVQRFGGGRHALVYSIACPSQPFAQWRSSPPICAHHHRHDPCLPRT